MLFFCPSFPLLSYGIRLSNLFLDKERGQEESKGYRIKHISDQCNERQRMIITLGTWLSPVADCTPEINVNSPTKLD